MGRSLGWLDVEEIAERLEEAHGAVDPAGVRFTDLARMVRALPGFEEDPAHPVNERILETIQALWIGARGDAPADEA